MISETLDMTVLQSFSKASFLKKNNSKRQFFIKNKIFVYLAFKVIAS